MGKLLHPKSDVDRLYVIRREGGRGLSNLEDIYKRTIVGLANYLQFKTNDRLLTQVKHWEEGKNRQSLIKNSCKFIEEENLNIKDKIKNNELKKETHKVKLVKEEYKKMQQKKRQEHWKQKPLHRQYLRNLTETPVNLDLSIAWLTAGNIKGETEALIVAAQDQALATAYHKKHIMKFDVDPKCRLCKQHDETIFHIMSGCPELAKKEYLTRHNNVCSNLHFNICKHFHIPTEEKWYQHKPEAVVESDNVTVLWDMQIHTDRHIPSNKPDILIRDNNNKTCYIIDVSVPADGNVAQKEAEKVLKYRDL